MIIKYTSLQNVGKYGFPYLNSWSYKCIDTMNDIFNNFSTMFYQLPYLIKITFISK